MILSLDLGSRRIGAVLAPPSLPLRPVGKPVTVDVDPENIDPTVAHLAELLDAGRVSAVILEHAPLYMPAGKSPAAYAAIATAHEVCSRLHERITLLCRERKIPTLGTTQKGMSHPAVSRQTWAHRVVPHHQGGITDAAANAGLEVHVDPAAWALLTDQDQRDAAGALVGHLLPAPRRVFASRHKLRDRRGDRSAPHPAALSPDAIKAARAARWSANAPRRRALTLARVRKHRGARERLSAACTCGPGGQPRPPDRRGRHKFGCGAAPPVDARGYAPMTR